MNESLEDGINLWTQRLEMKSSGSTNSLLESDSDEVFQLIIFFF
jgi:hypothetical protein